MFGADIIITFRFLFRKASRAAQTENTSQQHCCRVYAGAVSRSEIYCCSPRACGQTLRRGLVEIFFSLFSAVTPSTIVQTSVWLVHQLVLPQPLVSRLTPPTEKPWTNLCSPLNCDLPRSHSWLIVFLSDKEVLELFANSVSTTEEDNSPIQYLKCKRTVLIKTKRGNRVWVCFCKVCVWVYVL